MSTTTHTSRPMRNAWLSLLGIPVAVIVAFVVGSALMASTGTPEGELLPRGSAFVVFVVLLVLLAIPVFLAFRFGRAAAAQGEPRAKAMVPGWVGLAITVLALLQNSAAFVG